MTRYHHLSNEERFYIHQAVGEGKSNLEIARALWRHASTIGREQRPNMWPSAHLYTYEWARYFHRQRQGWANARKHRTLTRQIEPFVVAQLKCYLSPEQISAYLKTHHKITLSHETIYRFIYTAGTPMNRYAGTCAMPGRSGANGMVQKPGPRPFPIASRFRPAYPS